MLILSRKLGQVIVIDEVVKITVLRIRGDQVRLGIEAPRDIAVDRLEVWNQIHGVKEPSPSQ